MARQAKLGAAIIWAWECPQRSIVAQLSLDATHWSITIVVYPHLVAPREPTITNPIWGWVQFTSLVSLADS
jgi:hypothetical protein